MIPKDSELRESLEMFTGYSNSVSKRGKVPKHVITAMKALEALLNTPEGGLDKIKVIEILYEMRCHILEAAVTRSETNYSYFAYKIIHEDKLAKLKEKQAEVPTVEWIRSLKKNIEEIGEVKLDLRVLPVLEKLLARPKEKPATPEETIDGFEEASHSADNSTLTFKEKQKGE